MILPLLITAAVTRGQVAVDTNATHILAPADTTHPGPDHDIIDLFRSLFHLHSSGKSDAIQPGDKPVISALPAIGYTLQTRLAALVTGNIAFFTRADPQAKLSVINAMVNYTQNKQFTIPVFANVWLKGNQYNLLADWRYMKYPQSTFGLGTDSRLSEENPMDYRYLRMYQYLLRRVLPALSLGLGFDLDYHWKISEKGRAGGIPTDFANYGADDRTLSAGPALAAQFDSRNSPIRATRGSYASLVARFNRKATGSDGNWESATLDLRTYLPFPGKSKHTLALWCYTWTVLGGKPPYLDLPSNGWDSFNNTGRGYIQGRFRGRAMCYLETEYRLTLTHDGLLGMVLFANMESFSSGSSTKLQQLRPASGLGMRIKLNKKSNTNICIDYGFGAEGMKGLFVNVGEVF